MNNLPPELGNLLIAIYNKMAREKGKSEINLNITGTLGDPQPRELCEFLKDLFDLL